MAWYLPSQKEEDPGDPQHHIEPNEMGRSGIRWAVKGIQVLFCRQQTQFLAELEA